jgi:TFIIF-interacting CTD phosphatase-like protein
MNSLTCLPRSDYGNHVRVAPFTGNESDTELRDLLPFLDSLRTTENVRQVEKRFWRQRQSAPPVG